MNDVTAALVDLLDDAGILVDVARKPDGGGWQGTPGASAYPAYAVIWPGAGPTDGPITKADDWVDRDYQVSCWAATPDGAGTIGTRVINALSGQRIDTGERASIVPIQVERWGPVDTDTTHHPQHPEFKVAHVFAVPTAPVESGS